MNELAADTGLHPDRLARFLRTLCNSLIFQEVAPSRFANNALSFRFVSEGKRAIVGHWCVTIPKTSYGVCSCSCHADISFSADECRVSSCKTWDALTLPDYKDAMAANKAPFNIAYDTNLDYFQYVSSERPDIGNRAKKAMAGKGFNLGQYLSRELSSSVHIYPS